MIQPSAASGLREGVRWLTRNHSPQVAAYWFNGIIRAIDTLKTSPNR